MLERYLPKARLLARRFQRAGEPLDDLEQVASIGLVKALDRFDPKQGNGFWSYAMPTILGELKRHLRDYCWTVRVPRRMQEASLEVQKEVTALTGSRGRSPSVRELAEALGWSREEVVEALEAGSAFDPRSLDAELSSADGEGTALGDLLGEVESGYAEAEDRITVFSAMADLSAREVAILHLRFAEDLTQSEIAQRVGISQMHVSRLIRKALDTLRGAVGTSGEDLAAAA